MGDPEKRKVYDKYGSNGPQASGQEDLLNMFFGGGGRSAANKGPSKVKPTQKPLEVTLENIYNGEMIKVNHKRTRCC